MKKPKAKIFDHCCKLIVAIGVALFIYGLAFAGNDSKPLMLLVPGAAFIVIGLAGSVIFERKMEKDDER